MLTLLTDTETTGVIKKRLPLYHPQQPSIVSWAGILADETGTIVQSFYAIIKPDGWTIPDEAANVHGITTEKAEKFGIKIGVVATIFNHLCYLADEIVAYNAAFDIPVIQCEHLRMNREHYIREDKVKCAMLACSPILNLPPNPGYTEPAWPKMEAAYEFFFGNKPANCHNALSDATHELLIWRELRRRGVV